MNHLDPETKEGDYNEAMQHLTKQWKEVEIDIKFSDEYLKYPIKSPKWEEYKKILYEKLRV
jgi:hypothetical protein